MKLNKHTVHGKKGKTVCYTMTNFRFDHKDNHLKWDSFRFYTPEGVKIDSQGFAFFDVPADEIPIERDEILDKDIIITMTANHGVLIYETLDGAEREAIIVGMEGDIVATGLIPASPYKEIIIDYKEVTDGIK